MSAPVHGDIDIVHIGYVFVVVPAEYAHGCGLFISRLTASKARLRLFGGKDL
jgi:hypothetical protein